MQLVKINHTQCQEWTDASFILAPDEWGEREIEENIYKAQTAYLDTLKNVREASTPPNDYQFYGGPPYKNFPDKTVGEVQAEWEKKKVEYEEWAKKVHGKTRRFESFLIDLGFVSLWGDNDATKKFEINWGHRHGEGLAYGTPKTDPTKPIHAVGDDDWDDDDWY